MAMKWDKATELMKAIKYLLSQLDGVLAEAADAEREAAEECPPKAGEQIVFSFGVDKLGRARFYKLGRSVHGYLYVKEIRPDAGI